MTRVRRLTQAQKVNKSNHQRRRWKSEKYRYFEQVLIANGLWQPGKVERT